VTSGVVTGGVYGNIDIAGILAAIVTDVANEFARAGFAVEFCPAYAGAVGEVGFCFHEFIITHFIIKVNSKHQQTCVTARGGGVNRQGALGYELHQIVRAAGFWASSRQTTAAERLYTDYCADLVTVNITVADIHGVHNVVDRRFYTRMDAVMRVNKEETGFGNSGERIGITH